MNSDLPLRRLRLRFFQLKHAPERLALVCNDMRAVAGVTSVDASPLNGWVLIEYEANIGAASQFWNGIDAVLLAHHLNYEPRPFGRQARVRDAELGGVERATSGRTRRLTGAVAGALIERFIERNALALVTRLFKLPVFP